MRSRAILAAGAGQASGARSRRRAGRTLAILAVLALVSDAGPAAGVAAQAPAVHRLRRRLYARPPDAEITVTLPGGVPLVLVRILGGSPFAMGVTADERGGSPYEMPQHEVVIAQDFYLGKYEVTQAQWQAVTGSNPSRFSSCGPTCPVERVSWNDITAPGGFIDKLNQLVCTTKFRLPTEAEWEYAARAGSATRFSHGDVLECTDSCFPCATHAEFMWWCGNALTTTHPVGQKLANTWGLYDMHGNVWEWVQDSFHDSYTGAPVDGSAWEAPPGSSRVYRGGSWFNAAGLSRSAQRNSTSAAGQASGVGFRLARSR
ncbi:MAG: formylglycine-generating enzyme family protein [Acidobacteriota bacterium]